jgi:hypothetical protein
MIKDNAVFGVAVWTAIGVDEQRIGERLVPLLLSLLRVTTLILSVLCDHHAVHRQGGWCSLTTLLLMLLVLLLLALVSYMFV